MKKLIFLLMIVASVIGIFITCKRMDLNKAIDPTRIVNDVVFAVKDKENIGGYVTSAYLNNSHVLIGGKKVPLFFHIDEKSELYTDNSQIEFTSNNGIFYFDSDTTHLSGNSVKIHVNKTTKDTLFLRPMYTKDNKSLQFTINIKLYHFSNPAFAYYNQDFSFTMDTASLSIVPVGRALGGSVFAGKPNTRIVDTFLFQVNNYITVGGTQIPVSMTNGHYLINSSDYKTAVSFPLRDIFKDIDSSLYRDTLHGIYSQATMLKVPFKGLTSGKTSTLLLNYLSDENNTSYVWHYNVMDIPYVLRYQDCRSTALANPLLSWYAGSEFSSYMNISGNEFYPMESHYIALYFTDILEEDQYKAFNVSFRSSAPLDVYYAGGGSDMVGKDSLIYSFKNTNTPVSNPVSFSYNALTPNIRYFKIIYRTDQPVDLYVIQDCQGSKVIDTLHLHPVQSTPTIIRNFVNQVGYANTNKAEGGTYTYLGTITISEPNTYIGYFANMAFTKLLDNPTGYANISGKTFFVVDPTTNNKVSMSPNNSNNYFLMKTNTPYQIYFMRNEFFYSKGGYNLHNNFYRNYDNKLVPMDTAFNIVDDRINATLAQVNDKDNNVDNIAYMVYNSNLQFSTSGNGMSGNVPDAFDFHYKDVNALTYNLYIDLAVDAITNPAGYTLDKFNLTYWNGGTSNNNINGNYSYFRSGTSANPITSTVENRADLYMNCFQLVIGDGSNEAEGIPSKVVDITAYGGNNGNIQLAASTLGPGLYNYFMTHTTLINNKYADKTHKYYRIPVKVQVKVPTYYLANRKIDSLKFALRNSEIPNNMIVGGVSLPFPAVREFAIGNITYNVKKQDMIGMSSKFWNYTPVTGDYNADGSLKYMPKTIVADASGSATAGVWSYDKNGVENAIAYDLQIRTGKDIGSGGVVDIAKLANLFMDITDGNTGYSGSKDEFVFGADKSKYLTTAGNGYIKDYTSGEVDITPTTNAGSGRWQYTGGVGSWRVSADPLGDTTRRLYSCRIFISPKQFSSNLFDRLLTDLSLSINADNFINRDLTPTQMAQSNVNVQSTQTKVVDVSNMFVKHKAMEPNAVTPFSIKRDTNAMMNARVNDATNNFARYSALVNIPQSQNSTSYLNVRLAYKRFDGTTDYVNYTPTSDGSSFINVFISIPGYNKSMTGKYISDGTGTPYIYQINAEKRPITTGDGGCGDKCGTGKWRYACGERVSFGYVYEVTLPTIPVEIWLEEVKTGSGTRKEIPNTRTSRTDYGSIKYMNLKDLGGSQVVPSPTSWQMTGTDCFGGRSQSCSNFISDNNPNDRFVNNGWYVLEYQNGGTINEPIEEIISLGAPLVTCYSTFDADGNPTNPISCDSIAKVVYSDTTYPNMDVRSKTKSVILSTGVDNTHANTYSSFCTAPTSVGMPKFVNAKSGSGNITFQLGTNLGIPVPAYKQW